MLNFFKYNDAAQSRLYNKILSLSRNKIFYTNFGLSDTFQNRINLIFLHISFLFIRKKQKVKNSSYKQFDQKLFDLILHQPFLFLLI